MLKRFGVVMLFVGGIALAGCAGTSSTGWSESDREFVIQNCVDSPGTTPSGCVCVESKIENEFTSGDDYASASSAEVSAATRRAVAACGL
jgi:hypothetical protein